MLISIIIITCNRSKELTDAIESVYKQKHNNFELIVVDNNSKDYHKNKIELLRIQYNFSVVYSNENLGVAKGRNVGIEKSNGDFLVFLDDDAEFEHEECLNKIIKKFNSNSNIGIIAFKSINNSSGKLMKGENPPTLKNSNQTHTYVGVGHAINKDLLKKGITYPPFFYGSEEHYFSIIALAQNFDIIYSSDIIVSHKKSNSMRLTNFEQLYNRLLNRAIVNTLLHSHITLLFQIPLYFIRFIKLRTKYNFSIFKSGFYIIRKYRELKKDYHFKINLFNSINLINKFGINKIF